MYWGQCWTKFQLRFSHQTEKGQTCTTTKKDFTHNIYKGLPCFFSLSKGLAAGIKISISSGTFLQILTAARAT